VPDGGARWKCRTEVADGSGGRKWRTGVADRSGRWKCRTEVPDRSARLKSVLGYKALRAGRWRHGAGQEWPMEVADGSAGRECPMGVPDRSARLKSVLGYKALRAGRWLAQCLEAPWCKLLFFIGHSIRHQKLVVFHFKINFFVVCFLIEYVAFYHWHPV